MRRLIVCAAAFVVIFSLCSCSLFPDGTINGVEEENGADSELQILEGRVEGKMSDNIIVDASLDVTGIDNSKEIMVKEKNFTREESDNYAALFESDNCRISDVQEVKRKDGKVLRYIYKYDDGSQFYYGNNMTYRSYDMSKNSYKSYVPAKYGAKADAEELNADGDIDGLSKDDCKKEADRILYLLGMEVCDNPEIYTLGMERIKTVNEYSKKQNVNNKDMLPEDREYEAYAFLYVQKLSDGEFTDAAFNTDSYYAYDGEVMVIIGRMGLIYISAANLYDIVKETPIEITIDMYAALEKVHASKQYSTDITIKQIKYVYIPLSETNSDAFETTGIKAVPFWQIVIEREGDIEQLGKGKKTSLVYVNAVDGNLYTKSFNVIF